MFIAIILFGEHWDRSTSSLKPIRAIGLSPFYAHLELDIEVGIVVQIVTYYVVHPVTEKKLPPTFNQVEGL